VLCIMGPTASGKTGCALRVAEAMPVDVISVDSALVYRGMDIGTAKPDALTLAKVPHRLVDIRDPEQNYSAGEFVRDAEQEIRAILQSGRVPLLVGGTMMYFRSLLQGIAELPQADTAIRREIDLQAEKLGWPALHKQLAEADAVAAARINRNDSQRIQRALEVYRSSGTTLTDWRTAAAKHQPEFRFVKIALVPEPRSILHERIAARLDAMFANGFVDEVSGLAQRPGLTEDSPSMRAVGYRQVWSHLAGQISLSEAASKALFASRQLAKRQLTWLRSETDLQVVDPLEADAPDRVLGLFRDKIAAEQQSTSRMR
jgi:tRNA dimethylallyltransferase